MRSYSTPKAAAVSSGKIISTMAEAVKTPQQKTGMRNIVMPGARRVKMVVIMLMAEAMVPTPVAPTPTIHISAPMPGVCTPSASGMYMVQPKSAAPPGVIKPSSMTIPPSRVTQKPKAFRRGKATSGAPIWRGRM